MVVLPRSEDKKCNPEELADPHAEKVHLEKSPVLAENTSNDTAFEICPLLVTSVYVTDTFESETLLKKDRPYASELALWLVSLESRMAIVLPLEMVEGKRSA